MGYAENAANLADWSAGLDDSIVRGGLANWNKYDADLQTIVKTYNDFLAGTAGYDPLDWRIVKAMMWTECGANNRDWLLMPMQMGKYVKDGGVDALLLDRHGEQVVPPSYWTELTGSRSSIATDPQLNIKAGVGYLLMRLAKFGDDGKICGWRGYDSATIMARYNAGGDGNYKGKLDHARQITFGSLVPK